jgi:hypothetical protein
MASAINTPNATIYFKPETRNQHHMPGLAVRCRVMPKTIKFFMNAPSTGIKQVPRSSPTSTTVVSPHISWMGYGRTGDIVMDTTPVPTRLTTTPKVCVQVQNFGYTDVGIWGQSFVSPDQVVASVASLLKGCDAITGATKAGMGEWRSRWTVKVISATPTDIKAVIHTYHTHDAETYGGRPPTWLAGSLDSVYYRHITLTSGNLQHKEAFINGNWMPIDDGLEHATGYYYDDGFSYTKPLPGRFDTPIVSIRASHQHQWMVISPTNDEVLVPYTPRVVVRAVPVVPVAWEPTAQQVATALAVPRTVMPSHIKERMVLLGTTLNEQWQCCVCADDHAPSTKVLTDCGHYLCEGCQSSWKAKQKAERKVVWNCPECRCPHAY